MAPKGHKPQRKLTLHQNLHILRSLTCSKSLKKSSILMDAFHYIKNLKLQIEALNSEFINLNNQIQVPTEVQIERIEKGLLVRVCCKKGRNMMVAILEAFEEMGVKVLQARVSCKNSFLMEAICEDQCESLDVVTMREAVLKALENKFDGYNFKSLINTNE